MVCGLGLIKGVLCALNLTISLLGVAAIVVSAIVLNNPNLHDVNDHLGKFSNYPTAATFALVAGVTVLLFGVCGCCGACFGVGWLLLMFIIIMAGFVIVETVAMGLVWKYANSSELEETLTSTLYTFIQAKKSGLPNFLHDLQRGLSCCGAKGPDDYRANGFEIPASCYTESKSSPSVTLKPVLHQVGCGEAIATFLGKQSLKIGLLVLGIVVAQVVAISLAVFLYCKL
uniref:Tetraspanin n=1 Tax=Rhipicephalus pulchellus TaxID=72859 RepID=L7M314_RHIPC